VLDEEGEDDGFWRRVLIEKQKQKTNVEIWFEKGNNEKTRSITSTSRCGLVG
jgi:hypothetical protein